MGQLNQDDSQRGENREYRPTSSPISLRLGCYHVQ